MKNIFKAWSENYKMETHFPIVLTLKFMHIHFPLLWFHFAEMHFRHHFKHTTEQAFF